MAKPKRCLSCTKVSKTKFCSPECDKLYKDTNNLLARQQAKGKDWRESARKQSVLSQRIGYSEYGF
jgi:hypothetical protein